MWFQRLPQRFPSSPSRVESANRSFYTVFLVDPHETEGVGLYELGNHQWNIPRLKELLGKILPDSTVIEDFQVEHDFEKIGRRVMLVNARRLEREKGPVEMILGSMEDVTDIKNF